MPRKLYSREFKESAVKLVHEQGYSVTEGGKSLGIDPATIRYWLKKYPSHAAAAEGSLKVENRRLLIEREILKKSDGLLRAEPPLKFAFIHLHADEFPMDLMCQILNVSRSGYYAWRNRPPCAQARRQETLIEHIRSAHAASRQTYGAPRVCVELQAQGVPCSKNTVARLMRQEQIRSKRSRKFVVRTTDSRHPHPIAPNRLNRQFERSRPNQAWVCDITYVPTDEGWLYLAAVLDLCSRRVVGWSVEDHLRAELPRQALAMAVDSRRPEGSVLHHSDRGVQYASGDYQGVLRKHGLVGSMSRKGNCYDNAVLESFFGSLKTELVHHTRFATNAEGRQAPFEYVEVFYNRVRRHSALGYRSPADYEQSLN